jgi:hypothetical protein
MATSGTTAFNPSIDEIIEEAYERTNVRGTRTGYQLRSARRSLNILLSEWGNRGVNLWKVKLGSVPLVEGQAEYNYPNDNTNFPTDLSDILEVYVRNNTTATAPVDTALDKIGRSTYSALPNKLAKGTPSQYYMQRQAYVYNAAGAITASPNLFLYTTPSSSFSGASYLVQFYYMAKIEDVGAYTNTSDTIFRFYPALISGLAYYLSMKYSPEQTPALKLIYEDEMLRAMKSDGEQTSVYITPQTFYGDGV